MALGSGLVGGQPFATAGMPLFHAPGNITDGLIENRRGLARGLVRGLVRLVGPKGVKADFGSACGVEKERLPDGI